MHGVNAPLQRKSACYGSRRFRSRCRVLPVCTALRNYPVERKVVTRMTQRTYCQTRTTMLGMSGQMPGALLGQGGTCTSLLSVPPDLLGCVIGRLPPRAAGCLAATCKSLRDVTQAQRESVSFVCKHLLTVFGYTALSVGGSARRSIRALPSSVMVHCVALFTLAFLQDAIKLHTRRDNTTEFRVVQRVFGMCWCPVWAVAVAPCRP